MAFRDGALLARLYGYLKIPYRRRMLQGLKSGSTPNETISHEGIAAQIIDLMQDEIFYIIGPGTTTRAITNKLGLQKTLLGVDILKDRVLVARDVNEAVLLKLIEGNRSRIIITPIGGQGFLFGRGNQQISPEVIRNVGLDNIIVISTPSKLLHTPVIRVDTSDKKLDHMFAELEFIMVVIGYRFSRVVKIQTNNF